MIKYYILHIEYFKDKNTAEYHWEPLAIASMQLFSGFCTEFINIRLMCQQETIMDTVMNFFALSVIHEIDDYYSSSLQNFKLKQAIEDPPEIKIHSKDENRPELNGAMFVLRMIYKLLRALYSSAYYYFFPFLAIAMTFYA
jgi:hypothetical protein